MLEIIEKKDWFGLGYKPANEVVQKIHHKKFCILQETFHSVGYRGEDHVDVVERGEEIPN